MWTFDVDYVIRNNKSSYLLTTPCVFSTIVPNYVIYAKRSYKFLGHEVISIFAIVLPKLDWVVQGFIISCSGYLFSRTTPGKSTSDVINALGAESNTVSVSDQRRQLYDACSNRFVCYEQTI